MDENTVCDVTKLELNRSVFVLRHKKGCNAVRGGIVTLVRLNL